MRKTSINSEEIDLFVDPRQLTKEEQTMISNFIKLDKQKRKNIKEPTARKKEEKKKDVMIR